jgi:hypothetical protein
LVKILNQLKDEYQFVKTDEDGIYHCQERLSQWIICPSELALVPKNYPLLPLAKGPKLTQFVSLCFQQNLFDYLRLIMDIGRYTDPNAILQPGRVGKWAARYLILAPFSPPACPPF